ncbi:MAG TPA: pitrilysin family protein [Candidatus Kapabacteria bacterium]|nr:pitrilysin family protein [Candidatus Kapabacteria bacterium]
MRLQTKRPLGAMSLLALLLVAVAPGSAWSQTKPGSPYKTMTMDNGLQVVVIENSTVPLVTIDIAVRNGSFTEPDEFAGLSHLYEHMFFKANAALPSQEQFMKRVRELGIVFNGYTSQEVVTYFFTMPSRNLESGMKFMSDAIKNPLFKPEELVKEREVVLGEFDRNEAQPAFVLNYALDSALWMPLVSRKQPLGQRPVIKTATVEKMKMIEDIYYVPNNSALIVSGDVKAEQIFDLARKYYSDWKRGNAPFPTHNPPAFGALQSRLVMRDAHVPDIDLRMHFRGPSIGREDDDAYAGALLSTLLNLQTSRFYHNLVDSGVVTSAGGGYNPSMNVGPISLFMRTSKEKARRALDMAKAELKAMAKPGYFTSEDFTTARHIASDESIFEQDNPMNFAISTTARWWSMASLDYHLAWADHINKVTPEQLAAFVRKYIVDHPMVVGVGGEHAALSQTNITEEVLKW